MQDNLTTQVTVSHEGQGVEESIEIEGTNCLFPTTLTRKHTAGQIKNHTYHSCARVVFKIAPMANSFFAVQSKGPRWVFLRGHCELLI